MNRIFIVILALASFACANDPGFPEEPALEFISIRPDTVQQFTDSIFVEVRFTDGDGDLGDLGENIPNLTIVDNRVNASTNPITPQQATLRFILPNLTPDTRNPTIQGTITITIPPTAIRLGQTADSTSFDIQVIDRKDNQSNTITTDQIQITR